MTHKLLLAVAFTALSASLSWGEEARCPATPTPQQPGVVEDSNRTVQPQSSRHDSGDAVSSSGAKTSDNPVGTDENSDRTAAN
jgi:hypothetical protein